MAVSAMRALPDGRCEGGGRQRKWRDSFMRTFLKARNLPFLALLAAVVFAMPAASRAQVAVGVGITLAPPALPVYDQPPCPTEGYLWTPGYWAYGTMGYYWVPGVWVAPPRVGFLWTPGYWGFAGGFYGWHEGYWGPHVGFYGGINYGFGYGGVGFWGGRWAGGVFQYNTAAWHVGPGFHGVYEDRTFINNTTVVNNHYSFNGEGGVHADPTPGERAAMNEQHFPRTQDQIGQRQSARVDRSNYASVNHGTPAHPEGMGVNARQDRQQNRINQGVHSGQLTPGETSHIEKNETGIHDEAHADRQANGGHLTPQEHNQIEHQQNAESRQIARDKHNNKTDAHPHAGDKGPKKGGGKK
jgi:WXXGXW repeat (2 copies)